MEEMKTPIEWQKIFKFQIIGADGWRGENFKDWSEPISRHEFIERSKLSSIIGTLDILLQ